LKELNRRSKEKANSNYDEALANQASKKTALEKAKAKFSTASDAVEQAFGRASKASEKASMSLELKNQKYAAKLLADQTIQDTLEDILSKKKNRRQGCSRVERSYRKT